MSVLFAPRRFGALLLGLCLAWPPAVAQALDAASIRARLADQATLAGRTLVLNGAGLRKYLGFQVYVAALYLPRPTRQAPQALRPDTPRRLQLTLLRDTTTEQNLDALKGGLEDNNSAEELAALHEEIEQLLALIRTVREVPEGTRITLDYLPGAGTRLSFDDRLLGTIPGERFNRALMNIWLGDNPIQLSLKKALLGEERS